MREESDQNPASVADRSALTVRRMTTTNTLEGPDPRHTFLSTREVIARYGWGKSQGYKHVKTPGFPRPVLGGKYRLDTLMQWEDDQTGPQGTDPAPRGSAPGTPAGPPAKRTRGGKAAA